MFIQKIEASSENITKKRKKFIITYIRTVQHTTALWKDSKRDKRLHNTISKICRVSSRNPFKIVHVYRNY